MVKLANDLMPTLIVLVAVILLAIAIIYNSNRNQQEILEQVRQAVQARKESASDAAARIESLIKSQMQDPENWDKADQLLNP